MGSFGTSGTVGIINWSYSVTMIEVFLYYVLIELSIRLKLFKGDKTTLLISHSYNPKSKTPIKIAG